MCKYFCLNCIPLPYFHTDNSSVGVQKYFITSWLWARDVSFNAIAKVYKYNTNNVYVQHLKYEVKNVTYG